MTRTPRRALTQGYGLAGLVAAVAVLVAAAWAAVSLLPWIDDMDDFSRTGIPGELTVEATEPEELVVYYERRGWLVTRPLDPAIEVEVTGPDGSQVDVRPFEPSVEYRWLRRVGQAHVSFAPPLVGDYTVSVEGPAPGDATVAVGPSLTGSLGRNLAGPVAVLLTGLVAAAIIAVYTARRPAGIGASAAGETT